MQKIENVRIVNHDSIIENSIILIEGNKIVDIKEIEGKSRKTIIPGFIELHIPEFCTLKSLKTM